MLAVEPQPQKTAESFPGHLGLIQRVLPEYRGTFINALAQSCEKLSAYSGLPRPEESIVTMTRSPNSGEPDQLSKSLQLYETDNFHFLSTSSQFYFCYQRGLLKYLMESDPASLIVEANFRYLSSAAAIKWMKKRGRPVIGWGLGAPLARGVLSGVRKNFLMQFDALIAYSQRGAEQYAACGFPVDKIYVAPNAVAPAPKHSLPVRSDIFSTKPVLLFVGRLQARKRIPALLKACAALPDTLTPRLIIVGDGPESANLRELALHFFPQAEFVGAKHGEALDEYFRMADLFILPGTGGLAVQQAMAWGLPVIVAQGDGTQDDLVRPDNGWQIPPGNDEALGDTLHTALQNVSRLRAMGAESYRIVAEEINIEKMVSVFVQALNKTKTF